MSVKSKQNPRVSGKNVDFVFTWSNDAYSTVPKEIIAGPGAIAMELVGKWGMVSAVPDGEDSSGRAQVRLMTPEEVVIRAVQTANLFYAAMYDRGWIETVPVPNLEAE